MDANVIIWIGQILLALAFLDVGYGHSLGFAPWSARPGMGWMSAVGAGRMRIIAALEVIGAVALILPAATGDLSWLAPLAAACLAVLMALAIAFHARRRGEERNIMLNVILLVIAALVVYGRIVVNPL